MRRTAVTFDFRPCQNTCMSYLLLGLSTFHIRITLSPPPMASRPAREHCTAQPAPHGSTGTARLNRHHTAQPAPNGSTGIALLNRLCTAQLALQSARLNRLRMARLAPHGSTKHCTTQLASHGSAHNLHQNYIVVRLASTRYSLRLTTFLKILHNCNKILF